MNIKCMALFKIIICLIIMVMNIAVCCASGIPSKTVRVAYFDMGDYYTSHNGIIDSYDTAFLNKVAEYTNLKFEYIDCGTWANALKMLENHEVDLVGTVQWNQEREAKYEFCLQSYGFSVGELSTLPQSRIAYEDYDKIGNAVIGCPIDYIRYDELKRILLNHNINPEVKMYETQQDLERALEQGEIDVVAANSLSMRKNWSTVGKFSYASFYFMSWKGNSKLTDAIDEAIIKIQLYEKLYDDTLLQQYFPGLISSPFSKEELDCIAKGNIYTIYLDAMTKPIAWYNRETGEIEGIIVDVCKLISEKTGLKFVFKQRDKAKSEYGDNEVGYRSHLYESNSVLEKHVLDYGQSAEILNEDFAIYHRIGDDYDARYNYRVAVPYNREACKRYFAAKFPHYQLKSYENPGECIEAVLSGDSELAFLDEGVVNNYLISKGIEGIASLPTTSGSFGISLQFNGSDAPVLASIVSKGMKIITQDEISTIRLKYALQAKPELSLGYLFRQRLPLVSGIVVTGLILLFIIAVLCVYNYAIKRESKRVEAADKARSDFFSRMSHDMRTPMNGILGMAELSENENDIAVMQHNVAKIKESGNYLLGLINDSLDLQKLETGKLKLNMQVQNVGELVGNIIDMVKITAERKQIKFVVENRGANFEGYIKCDSLRLRQIFVNLLSNAVKFTPENGEIQFIVERLSEKNGLLCERIKVIDTGVGMSRDFVENGLFTAYSQERNSMTTKYAGSGLGLAIAKNLIEMMGGTIEVKSEQGEGSEFTVYLNFEMVESSLAKQQLQHEKNFSEGTFAELEGKRILLCEDNQLNAEIAIRLLERVQCSVVWAKDGAEGMAVFKESELNTFDAILMDIRMPILDGLTACRKIRSLKRADAATTPIIAMTANAYAEDVRRSMEAGMNDHLAKPIVPQELYTALIKVM